MTLDALEHTTWGPADDEASYLVQTCHRLRTKPIGDFTIEELRITIGQRIGLPFLIPLALERLAENPLAEGDFYPGDLLGYVLRVESAFWSEHPSWKAQLDEILASVKESPLEIEEAVERYHAR